MGYSVPFHQIREDMLSTSARQLGSVLSVEVDQLRQFEVDRTPLPENAQHLADCLYDAANAAMGGDFAKRQELERIGKAIRGLDDLPKGQVDEARLTILAHIRALAQEGRPDGRSSGAKAGDDQYPHESADYALKDCEDYDRLLNQLLRGGPFLRRKTAELLGNGAPSYSWFKVWGGIGKAEKRSAIHSGCTLITASGWGFQARGNTWTESLTPFSGNVGYRELLSRALEDLEADFIGVETCGLPQLERKLAEAYASNALTKLDSEVVEGAKKLAAGMKDPARMESGEWADIRLAADSPLRLLALIQAADWEAGSEASKALDLVGGSALSAVVGKVLKAESKKLLALVRAHPVVAAGAAAAIVGVGIVAWHAQQQLQRVAAALTLVHLSELGLLPIETA